MLNIAERLHEMNIQAYRTETRPTGRWILINCPFCQDTEKKGAVHADSGAFRCFHENRCGVSYNWFEFQRALGYEPKKNRNFDRYIPPKQTTYKIPEVHAGPPTGKVLNYLKKRGFDDDTIQAFKLGQKNNAIAFPYFRDEKLVGVKYRSVEEKKMWSEKGSAPILYNHDNAVGNELTIVEGELDAVSAALFGINAVSVPNGVSDLRWIEYEWEWLEQFTKIYLILDHDQAGQRAVPDIVNRLGKWRCFNVLLPAKDLNDCLLRKTPAEQIISCIENAQEFTFESLKSAGTFTEEVTKLCEDPSGLYGTPTPFEKLDYLLKGWRPAELSVLSGSNGSGKSTLINQIVLDLAKREQRSCIASLEMPTNRLLRWMVIQNNPYGTSDAKTVNDTLKWLDDRLYMVDTTEEIGPEALLDVFEFAARKYGVKFFFLDSLMRISFPYRDEYSEQKRFMSELLSFAKKHRVHLFVVAHPRKGATDSYTPGKVDVAGTANITNLAHNVLMMYRVPEEVKEKLREQGKPSVDANLYLKKNREHGLEGKIPLRFQSNNKTYIQFAGNVPAGRVSE